MWYRSLWALSSILISNVNSTSSQRTSPHMHPPSMCIGMGYPWVKRNRLRITQFNKKVNPKIIIAKKPNTFEPNSHRNVHLKIEWKCQNYNRYWMDIKKKMGMRNATYCKANTINSQQKRGFLPWNWSTGFTQPSRIGFFPIRRFGTTRFLVGDGSTVGLCFAFTLFTAWFGFNTFWDDFCWVWHVLHGWLLLGRMG